MIKMKITKEELEQIKKIKRIPKNIELKCVGRNGRYIYQVYTKGGFVPFMNYLEIDQKKARELGKKRNWE